MAAEVVERQERAQVREQSGLPLGDLALVEGVEPVVSEPRQGGRQGGQAHPLPGEPGSSQRPEDLEEAGIRPDLGRDDRRGPLHRFDEGV